MDIKRLEFGDAARLDADIARWDEFVFSQSEAHMFHRAGWGRVIETTLKRPAYYLYVEDGGEIQGVLPLIHVKSPLFGNSLTSTGFFVYGGPLATSDAAHAMLDAEAWRLAGELGATSLEYRNQTRMRQDWVCKDETHATFKREIDPDPDVNLKAIKRKQRAVVRKSLENNLEFDLGNDLDAFYDIMAVSYRNLGTPIFPKSFFAAMLAEFGDAADILSVRHDGEVLTSVMSFYFRDQVLPYFGGGRPQARSLGGNDFMYWQLIDQSRQRGYKVFDYGRSKVGSGAYSFKKNWGFEPQPLYYEFRLAEGAALPNVSPNNPKYAMFIKAWQRLPVPLANMIGPHVARHLG